MHKARPSLSSYLWKRLSQHVSMPKLLSYAALTLSSVLLPAAPLFHKSKAFVYFVAAFQGVCDGALTPLLFAYAFMDQWSGHTTSAARRPA